MDYPAPKFNGGAKGAMGSNTYNRYKITVNKLSISQTVSLRLVWPISRCGLNQGNVLPAPTGYGMSTDIDGWTKYCALNNTNPCCDLFLNKPLDINNQYAFLV